MKIIKYYSHYSANEDKVITECIKRNMGCITKGVKEAHRLLPNRTESGIKLRWYGTLKNRVKAFELKNDKESLINTKNKQNITQNITSNEAIFLKFARTNKINLLELRAKIVEDMVIKYKKSLEE